VDGISVEIFTGRGPKGEGVIGSREQKKWVKEYDDYRIEESKRCDSTTGNPPTSQLCRCYAWEA
jgi:hypothetical protein